MAAFFVACVVLLLSSMGATNATTYSKYIVANSNTIRVIGENKPEQVLHTNGLSSRIVSLELLSPSMLASGAYDGTLSVWNLTAGVCMRQMEAGSGPVLALESLSRWTVASACGEDERSPTASAPGTIHVWHWPSGDRVRTCKGHTANVWSLEPLPFNRLASGSFDTHVRVWNLTSPSGECLRTLVGHTSAVLSLRALPGDMLASGGSDQVVRVWNLYSGNCTFLLQGHASWIRAIDYDNYKLYTSSMRGILKHWSSSISSGRGSISSSKNVNGQEQWDVRVLTDTENGPLLFEMLTSKNDVPLLINEAVMKTWSLSMRACVMTQGRDEGVLTFTRYKHFINTTQQLP